MQRSYTSGLWTHSEGENHDSKQTVFLLTTSLYFPFTIFVDLPFLLPDFNVWPRDDDAYNTVSWLGQNDKDNALKVTLFYITTTQKYSSSIVLWPASNSR